MTRDRRRPRDVLGTLAAVLRLSWEASPSSLVTALAISAAQAVIPVLMVWLAKQLVDLVVAGASRGGVGGGRLVPTVVALGVAATALRVVTAVGQHRQRLYAAIVEFHAERRLLERVAQIDLGYFDQPEWYDRAARATRDLAWRPHTLAWSAVSLAGSLIAMVGMLALLLTLTPLLPLLAVLAMVPSALLQRRLNEDLYRFWAAATPEERERLYLRDVLSQPHTSKEVRAFNLPGHLLRRHAAAGRTRLETMRLLHARADRLSLISSLLGGIALAAAYGLVASRGLEGDLSPGDLAIVIGAFTAVTTQVGSFLQALFDLDQSAAFLQDYFSFLELEPLLALSDDPAPLPGTLADGLRVEGVTFSYLDQPEPVLHDVDLEVRPGQLLALVGANGAGKTTLVKLLLRFYDPQAGRITLGGVDLRQVSPDDLRRRVGVLFQDYARYELSVRENVALGRTERAPTDEAVWSALRAAHAETIPKGLRHGLDTNVGRLFQGGHDLSGGEWQRLALARLVYRDADIWILDEPTSSLDPEVEAALFTELRDLLQNRIGIVLSHRFSTVRAADLVAVMEDGRITELGTHEELVALDGTYAHLFRLQAQSYR